MSELTVQDGKLVVRNGALGTGQACCCDNCPTQECSDGLCCAIQALFNSINYLVDPFAGDGIECDCNNTPLRGYSDMDVTDGTCPGGGGACTFVVRVYWTATFNRRADGANAPCYEVDDPVLDDLVFTSVNCPGCEDNISDIAFFGHDDPGC